MKVLDVAGGLLMDHGNLGVSGHVCLARSLVFVGVEEAVVPGWETLVALVEEAAVVAESLAGMLVRLGRMRTSMEGIPLGLLDHRGLPI